MHHEIFLIALSVLLFSWIAAGWDLRTRRIPNRLVLAGAAMGLLLQGALAGAGGILAAIFGLLVGLAILMPGYLMGFTGAGDAKLMASMGTFLGPIGVLQAGLASIVVGGLIGLSFAVSALVISDSVSPWSRYGLMAKTLLYTGRPLYIAPHKGEVMGRKFPFAVSIAIGTTGWIIWQWLLAVG
ncbi:A24 family peptidase [Halomonas alkalisoli]|uniref:A24 family peptidase n=1 Tax=Halomonas alkalisoli TaxID=2907158 RepID=UPI001F325646|nr:A24 family peptidase [Halomonas alkalisoli]MCE9680771.1 A24 family peptidase [Halomonas alkalisoli]